MIADTARALGFTKFESTPKILRMADQTRVVPLGKLGAISVVIGDKPFRLNFIVIEPSTPSTYPMLLGRPWLYQAQVKTSWGKKTFTFGTPKTTITWETIVHQGETSSTDSGYTSDDSASTIASQRLEESEMIQYVEEDSSDSDMDVSSLFNTEAEVNAEIMKEPELLKAAAVLRTGDPALLRSPTEVSMSPGDSREIGDSEEEPTRSRQLK